MGCEELRSPYVSTSKKPHMLDTRPLIIQLNLGVQWLTRERTKTTITVILTPMLTKETIVLVFSMGGHCSKRLNTIQRSWSLIFFVRLLELFPSPNQLEEESFGLGWISTHPFHINHCPCPCLCLDSQKNNKCDCNRL